MQIRIVDTLDGLLALRPSWQVLDQHAATPMQQFAWIESCASAFAGRGRLHVMLVESGSRILAIAPYIHHNESSVIEWLGMSELQEPTDALWADATALPSLASA